MKTKTVKFFEVTITAEVEENAVPGKPEGYTDRPAFVRDQIASALVDAGLDPRAYEIVTEIKPAPTMGPGGVRSRIVVETWPQARGESAS